MFGVFFFFFFKLQKINKYHLILPSPSRVCYIGGGDFFLLLHQVRAGADCGGREAPINENVNLDAVAKAHGQKCIDGKVEEGVGGPGPRVLLEAHAHLGNTYLPVCVCAYPKDAG